MVMNAKTGIWAGGRLRDATVVSRGFLFISPVSRNFNIAQPSVQRDSGDKMDDFLTDTDSDYTSYWRDWVSAYIS